jgi:hypothetical protein
MEKKMMVASISHPMAEYLVESKYQEASYSSSRKCSSEEKNR